MRTEYSKRYQATEQSDPLTIRSTLETTSHPVERMDLNQIRLYILILSKIFPLYSLELRL